MKSQILSGIVCLLTVPLLAPKTAPSSVFPGKTWARKTPEEVGLDSAKLREFSDFVGGRGCVTRYGYLVYTWGDEKKRGDIASAAKPFYSYFLFKAVADKRIGSLDKKLAKWEPRLADLNVALGHKDRDITWRHVANQTSCYQLAEKPGTAFCYNDFQMALFWDTLFLKVYGATPETVDETVFRPLLTNLLQCEDAPTMLAFGAGDRAGRVAISPRDFCRFGLLMLRGGKWEKKQLLPKAVTQKAFTSPLPASLSRAGNVAAETISGARSIGSRQVPDNQTEHFGSYSWLWWINGVDAKGARMWPDAPTETYGAFGHAGARAMWVMPKEDIVVSYNDAKFREQWSNGPDTPTNQAMKRFRLALQK